MNIAMLARRGLGAVGVFALVGVAVVLTWRGTGTTPGARDLALWLVGLPLALLAGYWGVRWLLAWRRARQQAAGEGAAATELAPDGLPAVDPLIDLPLPLLASALWLPIGASAADAAEALAAPKRPKLHPRLRDERGLPTFAAPVDGVEPDAIAEVLRAYSDEAVGSLLDEAQLRALALLEPVAEELLLVALPPLAEDDAGDPWQADASPAMHPYAMHHSQSAQAPAAGPAQTLLRVRLLLPSAWSLDAQQLAAAWLQARAQALGHAADQISVDALPLAAPEEVWRLLDHLARERARDAAADDGRGDRHLLLAAHSHVSEDEVDRWAMQGRLLSSARAEGQVPGEGAAGLLLGPSSSAARANATGVTRTVDDTDTRDAFADDTFADEPPPQFRLHRIAHGAVAAHTPARTAAAHTRELLERCLDVAAQAPARIARVVSDADHRPSRAVEVATAVNAALPELDPVHDCRHLGVACGALAHVAPLALLAIAAEQAARDAAPVLVLSVAAEQARAALAVSPYPLPPPDVADADARPTLT